MAAYSHPMGAGSPRTSFSFATLCLLPTDTPANDYCYPLGPSRCYGFWQEVLGCYVVNAGEGEAGKKKCMPALEDYYECLHHRKEVRPPVQWFF